MHFCGKQGRKGCGQCGEVVNCNFVENMLLLVVHVGRWAGRYNFVKNMVQKVVGNVGR